MLPTTITSNGKTFTLNPRLYPDLNRSEAIFLARFAMLTKDGAKPCFHTDKEVMECFSITRQTASRLFNKLVKLGYIRVTKTSSPSGVTIRTVEVDPIKIKQTVPAMAKQAAQSAEQAETAQDLTPEHEEPMPAVSAQRPAVPSPTAPKSLNPDIAAAMARPIAGAQPLVKPEDWEERSAAVWALAHEVCRIGNERALLNRCCDLSIDGDVFAPADGLLLIYLFDAKVKKLGTCSVKDSIGTALGLFTYFFVAKFLRDHKECPKEFDTIQNLLRAAAKEYLADFNAATESGQVDLAAKVVTDLEFPPELKIDSQVTAFLNEHLVPRLHNDIIFNDMINEQLNAVCFSRPRAVNAITEPTPLVRTRDGSLRRKRELLTYAPAEGVDPRGLPCYQPFTNTVKFDLGPALDQTKFGRFTCYDLFGNLHDFKFDFSGLAHLLSHNYQDNITTNNLEPWEFGYTTCFDSAPCVAKAISDYTIFALVTELIAPLTADNVFYNIQEHQNDSLLELFQDYKTHRSLLMFACDVLYPATSDYEFDARPIFNYVRNNYCAGPKSEKDFAAFVVANNVVRALGDKEQSQKILTAIRRQLVISGRAGWVENIRSNLPTNKRCIYAVVLRELLQPSDDMTIMPRLTYPYLLMRKLFGIRHVPIEERSRVGHDVISNLSSDPVAQRDLSLFKSTYVADYPFLAQLGGDYE